LGKLNIERNDNGVSAGNNLVAFASLFDAAGAVLNFNTKSAELEILDGSESVYKAATDIAKFEETATKIDGLAVIFHAQTVDLNQTPFSKGQRNDALNALGIKQDDLFISQELAIRKTNRSWHSSVLPNMCTTFESVCTNRGSISVPGKRGRKSHREPSDFHQISGAGIIAREQLVTPALEELWKSLPEKNLVSTAGTFSSDKLKRLDPNKLDELFAQIERIRKDRGS
jgi:hypothetical protein